VTYEPLTRTVGFEDALRQGSAGKLPRNLHYDECVSIHRSTSEYKLQRSAPMVASYNLLSKAGLLWLYPPFQLCEASVTTIKSFQLMMLKQIQTDCQDLHHCSDEIIMDAVLSSFQFGELAVTIALSVYN